MKLNPLSVDGAFLIELDQQEDERGNFTKLFSADLLIEQGLIASIGQINNSVTFNAGTVRGLHYQVEPAAEAKILRCVRGRIYDVVADVRHGSPTFGRWAGVELSAEKLSLVYVPPGCAHGFMSLTDATEVIYTTSAGYSEQHERVVRWDDPFFAIGWPMAPTRVSQKDSSAADFALPGRAVQRDRVCEPHN
ncbi:dTDP-4-dehydrorhamnose 3,5-epimerase family protein [Sinorhizobium sp. BG8]|uniref:dTDP-4-dehydrorhamnose 3,5-epimerase family protein n=1 Tax=Sinorhizobium sp. BG8 TaxID=2613773 RepID=UPI00193E89AE|nr:dTDP-4-dehydrorhamnose 3,5-epimerase family protein [Sinorhizobium sp. BG8]QRM55219.1 dTDP-4-keto-6-deoxy-D-glucose epimerase [Sinorhizobium sp. BG8]